MGGTRKFEQIRKGIAHEESRSDRLDRYKKSEGDGLAPPL